MTTNNTQKLKRIVNPAILKLVTNKCTTNQNQVLQWRAINKLKHAVNTVYPDAMTISENDGQIRVIVDVQNNNKPSLWKRIKFLIKG